MSFTGAQLCTTTDHAFAIHAPGTSRPIDALDARDRKIIGAVIRALQRLLEDDGVRPALREDQRARIMVQEDKVLLLAAVSSQTLLANDADAERPNAPIYRLPPLQTRSRRGFAFG